MWAQPSPFQGRLLADNRALYLLDFCKKSRIKLQTKYLGMLLEVGLSAVLNLVCEVKNL